MRSSNVPLIEFGEEFSPMKTILKKLDHVRLCVHHNLTILSLSHPSSGPIFRPFV
ncbi:hypothetical protein M413DRAFT_134098 [Hebeloma cylindrosporum]|uniref:Uncharacterized protein n=1 Tax=Hebeloma cylindrosporum TaxID=76867 RepID=A0A0C3CFN8_HEBCY|nr:hypothetical protein M413DRAFT_134098 [Hebeloma cylindrosporum h7]